MPKRDIKRTLLAALAIGLNRLALKLSAAAQISPQSPEWQFQMPSWQQRWSDWAQLNVYHQANATLTPPKLGENRVIFFGDSITEHWNLTTYFPGEPFINRGIAGQTTPQLLVRLRPDVIALHPKVVVILAGTNDIAGNTGVMSLEQIQQNYASMAELAQVHQIRVVFASILPIHDYGAVKISDSRPLTKIRSLNQWLETYCAEHRCIYLDYYTAMLDSQGCLQAELSEDGLHPNARGYAVMAPLVRAAIQREFVRATQPE